MVLVTKGDFIWVEPAKGAGSVPLGARVIDADHGKLKVIDDQGKEEWLGSDRRVKLMHATSVQGVQDMIQLGDLHESAILRNIFIRYREKLIYTYTGSILIAVNPYMDIPIYTAEQIRLYRRRKIGELPPHIFAIADNAYTNMRNTAKNQSVIISGESGAGKTESTKLVLQFLATISGQHSWIEQQVLEANPILEAFGNAKTIKNDNSSRFGKYIDVHFNGSGAIEGARIEQYLLEKSRIVAQSTGERNYHIFYCMLAGLTGDERKQLELTQASDYFYLTQGKTLTAEGRDDAADLADIRSAMKVLMFKEPEIWSILKILAALLHSGNIKYRATMVNNMDSAEIAETSQVRKVARLLQVDERALLDALTTRTLVTREERVISGLNAQQAIDTRDALVKGIYGKIFVHIVGRINDAIYKPRSDSNRRVSIGILDIFGFENFDVNSFEQLCINYANEHLQQFFVRHIFKMEQHEYDLEQINWRQIEFVDNQETLDLIAQKPMNIMSLIDEESIFPKGTDSTMLQKLHANHAKNDGLYLKPKSDLQKAFGINHFAGPVYYTTRGFLEKNRDTFSADLHALIAASKMNFLVRLFDEGEYADSSNRRKGATVGGQFRRSLEVLMGQLQQTEPFFIRCVKPNDFKRSLYMDRDLVLRQLRYSGMMETIRIRRSGYPVRHDYEQFVARYRILVNGVGPAHRVDCFAAAKKICLKVLGPKADFQLGRSKVFLKDAYDLYLEQEYYRMLNERAVCIQTAVRGWCARRQFVRQREAAVNIQKIWRGFEQRRRYRQIISGVARLQAILRSRQLVTHYQRLRNTVIQFQAHCRGALIRSELRTKRSKGQRKPAMMAKEPEPIPDTTAADSEMYNDSPEVGQLFDFLPADSRTDSAADVIHAGTLTRTNTPSKSSPQIASSQVPPPEADPFDGEDLSKFHFGKFAATYFQGQATPQNIKKPLKQPLLMHEDPSTQLAAMAVWMTMLRFMGDLPDIKLGSSHSDHTYDTTPVMTRLYTTLGRKFSRKDVEEATLQNEYEAYGATKIRNRNVGRKLISMTLKKKSKLTGLESNASDRSSDTGSSGSNFNALLENKPMSSLDKLHYIIGLGILREELRDEIYCQLCKQLSSNSSQVSNSRGWILMSLCVGCFAPSERFIKYLYCFIRENGPSGVSGYADYIEQRLRRTQKNGTRHQPPSYVELQANKSKKPIVLAVTFMDGSVKTVHADSATTASELCANLAEKVNLQDRFGFSLYIALFDKVSSLGSSCDHVLDAVSQCEQYAKEQGNQEKNAPWRLFFRKEIFSPWHAPKEDPVGTNLIYQQVVRGVKYGEYRCDKEEDLCVMAAQQFYVEEGTLNADKLEKCLANYLPEFELKSKNKDATMWLQMVMHAFRKKFSTTQPSVQQVKEDIVAFAKFKWPLLFSRFYEALKFAGPPLPRNEVIVAVNYTGIYVVDDQEQVLLEFSFPEISSIVCAKGKRTGSDTFTVRTVSGDDFVFQSPNALDIRELVDYFLEGLKKRSRYLVATQPQKGDDENNFLEFERGDLLVLAPGVVGDTLKEQQVVKGENARTGLQGMIRAEYVYVLPTLAKPSVHVMELFPKNIDFTATETEHNKQVAVFEGMSGDRPYTLERFAQDNFKVVAARRMMTLRRRDPANGEVWRFSREPIKEPLLKKIDGRKEPSIEAAQSYLAIMKYMGDHPTRRSRLGTELTDQIFNAPIKYEILRDECYCQLMKQLTLNPSLLSEERGWELMWLATGLFAPSQSLLKEVAQFLKTRQHPISADCFHRIQKMLKSGHRKYPPYTVEVEAIQNKTIQILHKVFFPDHTDEPIELDSATKARDFCQKIAFRLGLKGSDGFSLFVKIGEKVLSVPETEFFFDFVRHLSDWALQNQTAKEYQIIPMNYQVFFMRKLWLDVVPGEDRNADLVFHYHQEVPKYLSGYHKVSKHDCIELAALILRARTRPDKVAPIGQLNQIMTELVPKDLIKTYNGSDWKKHINVAYAGTVEAMSCDDAKMAFLKYISGWPTFGSTFFDVKQSADQTLPNNLLVAINRNGVTLYNIETKALITTYPFTQIGNWTSGSTYFHLTVGNLVKGSRLLLETKYGYKMDDLLTSYISVLISAQTKNPKMITAGNAIM